MAAWFTIYCAKSVRHVTAGALLALIRNLEDPYILAEEFGIEDEETAVTRAMKYLHIARVSNEPGVKFLIRYKPRSARPILFHLWTQQARLRTERAEALEQFDGAKGQNVTRIRKHLANCVAVVALEMGWAQIEDMGIVLASQIAEFLAVEGGGLIRDQVGHWWAMKKGAPVLLVG